jgi:hypothetical protein
VPLAFLGTDDAAAHNYHTIMSTTLLTTTTQHLSTPMTASRGSDFLSPLPKDVQHHILCFLQDEVPLLFSRLLYVNRYWLALTTEHLRVHGATLSLANRSWPLTRWQELTRALNHRLMPGRGITALSLSSTNIPTDEARALLASPALQRVTVLDLDTCRQMLALETTTLGTLEQLSVTRCARSTKDLAQRLHASARTLRHLVLDSILDVSLGQAPSLCSFPQLTYLAIINCPRLDSLTAICACPQLELLCLGGTQFPPPTEADGTCAWGCF